MSIYTTAKNVALFFIASLVVVSFNYNNINHFSSFDIVPYHQTSLAIPNLQTNNNNNISTSGSNDTSINFVPTVNHSPVANASADQTVNAVDTVTLDGSKSTDPDGNIVSYLWKQIEGPTVDLYNNTNPTANFLSPTVSADTPLKFSLTVKDSKDIPSIPAIVTITVKAVPLLTTNMTAKGNITTTDNVSSLTGKGDALYYQEKYDQAIQYYDRALAIDPNDTYALSSKGYALDGLGKYEEAIEYYDKALAIDPNDANALNGKGYALGNLGNYTEAIEYLDKALAIQPDVSVQATHPGFTNNMTHTMMEPGNMTMTMGGENVTSSINLRNIISNAIGSQIKVSLSNATTTAETSIGNNSHAVAAHIGDVNGYLVYTIFVLDPNMNFNTVIVDPGNGQVLSSKQMSMEEHLMMHKGMMMGPGMLGPDISHTGQG